MAEEEDLTDPEQFALRLILLHRKEASSFEDIQTVDRVTHDTFQNAARVMSLLEDNAEHRRSLPDAVVIHMPPQMRQLFATLILTWQKITSDPISCKIGIQHSSSNTSTCAWQTKEKPVRSRKIPPEFPRSVTATCRLCSTTTIPNDETNIEEK
eukprot:gene1403-biopygen1153